MTGHGLETADVRKLSKALHAQAEAHAAEDSVCCFDLVAECQARRVWNLQQRLWYVSA